MTNEEKIKNLGTSFIILSNIVMDINIDKEKKDILRDLILNIGRDICEFLEPKH